LAVDKLAYGPPPAWVVPTAPKADDGKAGDAPVKLLLQDQQMRLDPRTQTVFTETLVKIQNSQGLSAGTISIAWKPDTDEMTVHKLVIRRGDTIIDVLKAGQSFTILRRETNLERAALDGVLTATLQPEGLQVGDVIDFAASRKRSDPIVKGHVEQIAATWNRVPIAQARFRADWPATLKLRMRSTEDLPALQPTKSGDRIGVAVALDDVQPLIPPAKAPPRFANGRLVEMTDFASWADAASLMRPYFVAASAIPAAGPLRDELSRIAAASKDPKTLAQAALTLVQTKVRYLFLAMNDGALNPAAAELTWSRRFGDCKGKTVLLLGMLRELGVPAEAVLVNTTSGDGIDERLPTLGAFNHVLVRATIGGRTYWLDGTRPDDGDIDRIETPMFRWGLPLIDRAELVRILPEPLTRPNVSTEVRIDASKGATAPAPFHGEILFRGDAALRMKLMVANATPAQRDEGLRKIWKSRYDFVDLTKLDARWDEATGTETFTADGTATLEWTERRYEPANTDIGSRADFTRPAGPHRDAPYAVGYPGYGQTIEEVILPPGKFGLLNGGTIDQTVAGVAFHRSARIENGRFRVERSERSVATEFPAAEAPAAQAALRALRAKSVYLVLPPEDARTAP
jgi:hypothetical protein